MAALDLSKLAKEKKFWVASFLVAWAAALQGHMMWLQRQDAFKDKFGDPNDTVATDETNHNQPPPPKNEQLTADAEFR